DCRVGVRKESQVGEKSVHREITIEKTGIDDSPVYEYDGSFDGLLCCLFAVFSYKEFPAEVVRAYHGFLPCRRIASNDEQAARVQRGIVAKMGQEALRYGERAYLSEREGIEKFILAYWKLGFSVGVSLYRRAADECVAQVHGAAKYTMNERHRILQFLRFSDSNGVLTSVISPNANVLPLIAGHFADRFPRERFFIYDSARGMGLVYADGKYALLPVSEYAQPAADEEEQKYRDLFTLFYNTIEIKERHNERCRMSHMPKRFWKNMTEFTCSAHNGDCRTATSHAPLPHTGKIPQRN
ncbi:MAG: TIGR03915 family putative DNA repair protein, partial [Clostridiales bacterium]|nr:TIGR03915 family putative DNA repair protein [Clostridiales bacterium]